MALEANEGLGDQIEELAREFDQVSAISSDSIQEEDEDDEQDDELVDEQDDDQIDHYARNDDDDEKNEEGSRVDEHDGMTNRELIEHGMLKLNLETPDEIKNPDASED